MEHFEVIILYGIGSVAQYMSTKAERRIRGFSVKLNCSEWLAGHKKLTRRLWSEFLK